MSQILSLGCEFCRKCPVDSIQIAKTISFDWADHFKVLPTSLDKFYVSLNQFDECVEIFDLFNCLNLFIVEFDQCFTSTGVESFCGAFRNKELSKALVSLIAQTAYVSAFLGAKCLYVTAPTEEILILLSTFLSLVNVLIEMQETFKSLSSADSSSKEQALSFAKASLCLIKNLTYLSGTLLEASLKRTITLSCGSLICAAKVALFIVTEKKIFTGEN